MHGESAMFSKVREAITRLHRGQAGMTGPQAAILLIAFSTVAAVFGYAVLNAGLFSAERGKETVYAGLQQARGNLELSGSVIVKSDNATATDILLTVRNAIAGTPIDMTANAGGNENRCVISLTTASVYYNNIEWAIAAIGADDGDNLLESGEQMEVTVDLTDLGAGFADPALGPNYWFNIQVKPMQGSTMTIQRTLPAGLDPIMDMH
jgi:flagellin FlaB